MKFVVHCLDHKHTQPLRLENYGAHKAYLEAGEVRTVISGPLLAPGDGTMIGSLFVFEAGTLAEVTEFNANDPFTRAGVWAEVKIHPFNMRVDNRS
jgi:uncharacterized protein YciI